MNEDAAKLGQKTGKTPTLICWFEDGASSLRVSLYELQIEPAGCL